MYKLTLILTLLCITPVMASADKGDTDKTYYLDEIVTSATRVPQLLKYTPSSVTVITEDRIKAKNPKDVGDVLEDVAGVKVERYGSLGSTTTVHIRGLLSSHVLVMVDGRPVNAPSQGIADLSWLSVENIEKVEIVRGAGSAQHGSSAVAGVVNIITKNPPEKTTAASSISYGTWDTLIAAIESGTTLNNIGLLINSNIKRSDGHRDHSEHNSSDINLKVKYAINTDMSLILSSGYYHSETEIPGAKPPEDITKRTASQNILGNDQVSALFDFSESDRFHFTASLDVKHLKIDTFINYWIDDSHMESILSGSRQIQDDIFKTMVLGGDAQYSIDVLKNNLLTGGLSFKKDIFDVETSVIDTSTETRTHSSREPDRNTLAVFIEDELTIDPLTIVLGGRWDDPDDFDSQTSLKASMLLALGDNTNIRASYGNSFKAPTLNDLYWPSDDGARGNPDLTPEKGTTYEIGVEQIFNDNTIVRASVFRQEIEDMIAWAPTGPLGPWGNKWQPDNLNNAEITGIEFESRVEIIDDLNIFVSYTYLDGEQKNEELVNSLTNEMEEHTRVLAYLPEHKLDLGLAYDNFLNVNGLRFNVDTQYVSEIYQYFQNYDAFPSVTMDTKKMDAYWLTNIKVTKEIGNTEVFLASNNLFDTDYAIQFGRSVDDGDYPMPGRSITGGIKVSF
jgi:outer membrane cobalamin receptor